MMRQIWPGLGPQQIKTVAGRWGLTSRQIEIAMLVSQGLSNKEVARVLNLAEGTVKLHLHRIYAALRFRNRTALATFAREQMMFPDPSHAPHEWPSESS